LANPKPLAKLILKNVSKIEGVTVLRVSYNEVAKIILNFPLAQRECPNIFKNHYLIT